MSTTWVLGSVTWHLTGLSAPRGTNPDMFALGDTLALAAVLYTLGSVTIPSLASVYNEMALKKHMDTSVHLQVLGHWPSHPTLRILNPC